MSDTASYSDLMFGLFWCLGYQFSPRLAEMKETRFWRIDPAADYQVCIVLEQKSGLSYKVASQAEREEIQKKRLITSVVITVPLLHVYMTTIYFFHDIIGLKPLSCSVAPQPPTS